MKRSNLRPLKKLISRKTKVGISRITLIANPLEQVSTFEKNKLKNPKDKVVLRRDIPSLFSLKLKEQGKKQKPSRMNPQTNLKAKKDWISKVRLQRYFLKTHKRGLKNYRQIYLKIKGNCYRNLGKLKEQISKSK